LRHGITIWRGDCFRETNGLSIEGRNFPQFYITPAANCPYLEGQFERKIFTHLIGDKARDLNHALTNGGFRRSQNIAYRQACENCCACISTRVVVDKFKPTRSQKRSWRAYRHLHSQLCEPSPSQEQYSLFRSYIDLRHGDGGMADMSILDYAAMVEESFVDTRLIEYRQPGDLTSKPQIVPKGELAAVAITDRLDDGLSMIYSFYDPGLSAGGLGTYLILDHIEQARKEGLAYVYLGYWVKGSPKMDYKIRYRPQEHLTNGAWSLIED
jgi:leucyl-tRNA---protein transferase